MNDYQTNVTHESTLKDAMLPAAIVWLKIVFYFIILPYKIWKAATLRLASLRNKTLVRDNEEFPVYTFFKINYDASIFSTGILSVIVLILGIFWHELVFVAIGLYVIIPLISFLKEVITISLGVIKRLEAIEENTRK